MTASSPAPRPGFLSGFAPSFTRGLATAITVKKGLILVVVLAVPALLVLAARLHGGPRALGHALPAVVLVVYLQFLVPIAGLLFGTGVILDDAGAGNLPYLFTRPVPRSAVVLGKSLAALLAAALCLVLSLAVTLLVARGARVGTGFPGRAMTAVLLALPAYLAAFTFLSVFTRWALVAGFFYAFGLEFFLGMIPGMIRKSTLIYYARSLLGEVSGSRGMLRAFFGREGPASPALAAGVLLGTALLGILLTCLLVAGKEFVSAERE